MKKTKALAYSALSIALAAALPVSAQIRTDINAGLNTGVSVGGVVQNVVKASASTSVGGSVQNGTDSGAQTNAQTGAETDTNTKINTSARVETFSISRDDVKATTTEYVAPANVTSSADLETYSRGVIMADENVVKISTGDSYVSVWYREPMKVLGILPVSATVKATVDASGEVSVDYPWWHSLFVKDDTTADFQNDLDMTAGVIAKGESSASLSSSAKARLVNAVRTTMKAHYDANASASSSETAAY
ncbi:MAG TPA: hypothetical protein VHD69_00485 [Candidatus Paceibacterota bacterium]|nr:hypothetical protein [Candidatus Paceibacterota bacterium]